jgi:hypothetical protein
MRCVGRARLVVCLVAFAAAITAASNARALTPPPAGLTCAYSGPPSNTLTFRTATGEETLLLRRVGDEIRLFSEEVRGTVRREGKRKKTIWRRVLEPASCNATPTVQNTDTITVRIEADEIVDLDVSLEGGPLAPGATLEPDGTSEIEVIVESVTDAGHNVRLLGTPQRDWFRFGSGNGAGGLNTNAQDEPASPDVDVTFTESTDPTTDSSLPAISAYMGAGDDVVTDSGGPEFQGFFPVFAANGGPGNDTVTLSNPVFLFIKGAGGNDFIQGAHGRNIFFGGPGVDTIVAGKHGDDIDPGKGSDLAILKGGPDIVAARDRTSDRIRCGKGRDAISKDRKDRSPGCELKTFEPFQLKPFDH